MSQPVKKREDISMSKAKPSRCIRCGSTERTGRVAIRELECCGTDDDGFRYTHTTWARVSCKNCGTKRIEARHENRP